MLEMRNVSAGYASGFMLEDINLVVPAGEVVGIVGPNGSGKTTLLRVASRALRPRRGEVLVGGRDQAHLPLKELARMLAVVPQTTGPVPMTVEEYVLLGRIPHYGHFQFLETHGDRTAARRAMELTECLAFRDHEMGAISGGERQLAVVARALAQEPKLLLLDEPTSYLDIAHQVRLLDLIRRLNKDLGLTVLMVMHDLNAASEYCHRLVLMSNGRIRSVGAPEEVIDYRVLEEVYQTVLVVGRNGISGKPFVFPVSEEIRAKRRSLRKTGGGTDEGESKRGLCADADAP
jgi:iron complex transport system ATP-binding protein